MNTETKKITCVIIDDEIEACDRLESLLTKIPNIKVLSKETRTERGIQTVIELFPDIVFLDVEMPRQSGFDVINEIRKNNVFPIFIFVTGYNQYAIKAIREAAFDYLLKPVDIDELKDTIERFGSKQKEDSRKILPAKLKSQYSLTDREIEIINLLLHGKSSKEIGEMLFISKHTVDTHRRNILEKIGISSSSELPGLINSI
jgi:DNA-binding NarL/FixJ family response regulator